MPPPSEIDTLVDARWVVPVEPAHAVLPRHSVAIHRGRIADILPTESAHARYRAKTHWPLRNHLLIPGLVNLHTHAAMTLLRGLADDLPLMEWLQGHIWPAESRFMSPEFVHDGSLLACGEMLRGGITCFSDMYFYQDATATAVLASGMRAALGIVTVEFPTPFASGADDYLAKGLAVRDAFRHEARLSFTLAPHAPYTVSDATFGKILTYSEQLDLPIHLHLHETQAELDASVKQHGARPLQRLHALGLLSPSLIAAHMVQLTAPEIRLLAEHGCHVAHCPSSNLKLASGIGPLAEKLAQRVNVALGTDGAASNNRLDILTEMRLAALLAKGQSRDASAIPAFTALQMATLNGARALGLERVIGSLVPGKAADLVAIDFSAPEMAPCYDPISHLVYVAGREHVSHVWVEGELLLEERRLTRINALELQARASQWQERIHPPLPPGDMV
jgi:5-methylthioadenosine/S-adenosylhomocysteine deaminase